MEESLPTTLRLWSATWFARAKGALVRQTLLHKPRARKVHRRVPGTFMLFAHPHWQFRGPRPR